MIVGVESPNSEQDEQLKQLNRVSEAILHLFEMQEEPISSWYITIKRLIFAELKMVNAEIILK